MPPRLLLATSSEIDLEQGHPMVLRKKKKVTLTALSASLDHQEASEPL